ncbi:MAG: hypothetical protein QM733_08565 [Ilumatobacteraceae bacterium]
MGVPARLEERFGRCPLVVVTAPAGFGKTTLLQSWWRRAGDVPKAMISFDAFRRPNALDAARAAVRGLVALGVSPAAADELAALVPSDGGSFGSEFVRAVEDAMRELPGELVVFCDDVHGLVPDAARELGRILSMVADDRHRVVVATRVEPPWPVHRWGVTGFADLLTADDLRLTTDEVAEMLGPDFAAVAPRVAAVTGGWAAALEVVRWRLQVDPQIDVERAAFDLVDYVGAEVLPLLDPADVRVLIRASILEPFPVGVAVAVTAEPVAPRVLDETVRRTSLASRLTDGRYAYHAVLREALRRRLTVLEPGVEPELHLRAADAWLEEPDSFVGLTSALDHLVEARQWERALELLRRRWIEIDQHARLDRIVEWLEAIPGRWWRDDVETMLLFGWANLRTGRASRALEIVHDPTIAANPAAVAVARLAYASTTAWSTDPLETLALVDEVRPTLAALDARSLPDLPAYPGVANFVLAAEIATAQACSFVGRFADAAREYELALRSRAEIAPMTQVAVLGGLAFALAVRGEPVSAAERAEEALGIAADTGTVDHVRIAPALIGSAVVAALAGDTAVALERLDEAARRCRAVRAANLLRMADMVGAMCGAPPSYLADVEPKLTPARLPLVDQFVVAASARRRARLGDAAGAAVDLHATTPHELTLSAWVEVLLADGDRREVRRWVGAQPSPTCVHGVIVRRLVEAATADRGEQVAELAGAAADAAAAGRLLGVLLDAPSQLWQRPEATHSSHPLLLEALQRLAAEADDPSPERLTPRRARPAAPAPAVAERPGAGGAAVRLGQHGEVAPGEAVSQARRAPPSSGRSGRRRARPAAPLIRRPRHAPRTARAELAGALLLPSRH